MSTSFSSFQTWPSWFVSASFENTDRYRSEEDWRHCFIDIRKIYIGKMKKCFINLQNRFNSLVIPMFDRMLRKWWPNLLTRLEYFGCSWRAWMSNFCRHKSKHINDAPLKFFYFIANTNFNLTNLYFSTTNAFIASKKHGNILEKPKFELSIDLWLLLATNVIFKSAKHLADCSFVDKHSVMD